MTAALTVFSNHGPPPPIESRIARIAPRSVFLIHADPGLGGEHARADYYAAAESPRRSGSAGLEAHRSMDARPAEYERRVVGAFDRSLLDSG
jgi:hypothetical protein